MVFAEELMHRAIVLIEWGKSGVSNVCGILCNLMANTTRCFEENGGLQASENTSNHEL